MASTRRDRKTGGDSKRVDYRSRHRTRGHDEAHAEADSAPAHEIVQHPLVPANEPRLIDTDRDLLDLVDHLLEAKSFGYDTEFIGEHTYHPKLCVVQVATPSTVTLIDTLSNVDLNPFWRLLADERVEKIVHAGLHDLEPVVRHLNRPPMNVFDTQIAAAFVGLPYPMATSKLIHALTGADVGKGSKFSQWDRRPLTSLQLHYAGNDVRYLPLMRQAITERLMQTGTVEWCAEECRTLSELALYQFDPTSQKLRVRGVEGLDASQRTVLKSLLGWRERIASAEDVPSRTLLRDDVVLALATLPVKSVGDLDRVRGLPRPVEEAYGREIVALIAAARADHVEIAEDAPCDDNGRRDWYTHRTRIERVWKEIQKHCVERGIDSKLVLSKREITQLVWAAADGVALESINSRLTHGWRWQLLGPLMKAALNTPTQSSH